jgi:hypothetical protein
MLPPPTQSTKEMEKTIDGSNVEGLVMDLAKIEGG